MLNNIDSSPPNHLKKKEINRELKQLKEKMIAFQKKMNAQGKYSLLLVFQGMDASGKDGATRRVLESKWNKSKEL
jgi:polyphosphate kinase 2 (PPK2 family)